MKKIDETLHKKAISLDGLTRGEVQCHQRRVGSRVNYAIWLIQGTHGSEKDFFIAEYEIDDVIKYLTGVKEEISIHRNKQNKGE